MYELEGTLYLYLNMETDASAMVSLVQKAHVYLVEQDPDRFGVLLGLFKQDFPELDAPAVEAQFGVDPSTYLVIDCLVEDPLCVRLRTDIAPPILDAMRKRFEVLELPEGRLGLRAGRYQRLSQRVEGRVTHQVTQ